MVLFMIPLSGVVASFYWVMPGIQDLLILAVIGISGTAAQMLLAQALKEEDTGIIMPFEFLKLIWAVLIGYLVFSDFPTINTWIGSVIIFFSTLYVAYREIQLGSPISAKKTSGRR